MTIWEDADQWELSYISDGFTDVIFYKNPVKQTLPLCTNLRQIIACVYKETHAKVLTTAILLIIKSWKPRNCPLIKE